MRVTFREVSASPYVWELVIEGEAREGIPEHVRVCVRDVSFEVVLGRESQAAGGGGDVASPRRFAHGVGPGEPLAEVESGAG
jgi:hypothetical protein